MDVQLYTAEGGLGGSVEPPKFIKLLLQIADMASVNAGNPITEILKYFKNFLGEYGHETRSKRDHLQRSVLKPPSL